MREDLKNVIEVILLGKKPLKAHQLWNYYDGKLSYEQFKRELRRAVRDLRLKGQFIGSGNQGYYMVKTKEEAIKMYNKFMSVAKSHLEMAKQLKIMINRFDPHFNWDSLEDLQKNKGGLNGSINSYFLDFVLYFGRKFLCKQRSKLGVRIYFKCSFFTFGRFYYWFIYTK